MPRELRPGLYDEVITAALARALETLDPARTGIEREAIDPAEADQRLARFLHAELEHALKQVPAGENDRSRLAAQLALANRVLATIASSDGEPTTSVPPPGERLLALFERRAEAPGAKAPERPGIPLSSSALLVNARDEHRIGRELERELASADRIDLLCSFVKWSGLRLLLAPLEAALRRGAKVRVLTTVYMGVTERRALDALRALGADLRVSYDARRTRLHAKAWLFRRESGFDTAYVGSSNLSASALLDGLEWNVRLARADAGELVDKFAATFESYWEDGEFEPYEPERFEAARSEESRAVSAGAPSSLLLSGLEVRPYPFQVEILDRLEAERELHGRMRNLVVAATGTGKTVIAALDYRRLRAASAPAPLRLLFVAHRREILEQTQRTFREVLADSSFGELWVAGERPVGGDHLFASVQTLANVDIGRIPPDRFDVVIVDEFHHAAAPTYERLLSHFRPRILVGLTATPERMDGQSVLDWFDGRIAAELRLWTALERGLLAPFQYFGVHDEVNLADLPWSRGYYERAALERVYTAGDARARLILREVRDKVGDPGRMRALGFCVGVAHAHHMAEHFNSAGLPSAVVVGETPADERDAALRRLRSGDLRAVFTVDVFNEGVDVPEVDTVLFLRPTESATVFLQQLGRGLRLAEGKDCLTVLDFIGNASRRYRFDIRFRALVGSEGGGVRTQIEQGFPVLPAGCAMRLEPRARDVILEGIRAQLVGARAGLVEALRELGPGATLLSFLRHTGLTLPEVYRRRGDDSWTRLRREAGFLPSLSDATTAKAEQRAWRALATWLHVNDAERIRYYRELLSRNAPPAVATLGPRERRRLEMLRFSVWGRAGGPNPDSADLDRSLQAIWRMDALRSELAELLEALDDRLDHLTYPLADARLAEVPLLVHASYQQDEVLAAFGETESRRLSSMRQGVRHDAGTGADLLFVTLAKSESDYSPSTLYRDYAISPVLFHWESQSTTSTDSPTGRRYRSGDVLPLLFVRHRKKDERGETSPYVFLGNASYVEHRGERPMAITWRLERAMPAAFLQEARVAAG